MPIRTSLFTSALLQKIELREREMNMGDTIEIRDASQLEIEIRSDKIEGKETEQTKKGAAA